MPKRLSDRDAGVGTELCLQLCVSTVILRSGESTCSWHVVQCGADCKQFKAVP